MKSGKSQTAKNDNCKIMKKDKNALKLAKSEMDLLQKLIVGQEDSFAKLGAKMDTMASKMDTMARKMDTLANKIETVDTKIDKLTSTLEDGFKQLLVSNNMVLNELKELKKDTSRLSKLTKSSSDYKLLKNLEKGDVSVADEGMKPVKKQRDAENNEDFKNETSGKGNIKETKGSDTNIQDSNRDKSVDSIGSEERIKRGGTEKQDYAMLYMKQNN